MCDSIRWSNGLPYKRRGRKDINVKRDDDYVCRKCKKVNQIVNRPDCSPLILTNYYKTLIRDLATKLYYDPNIASCPDRSTVVDLINTHGGTSLRSLVNRNAVVAKEVARIYLKHFRDLRYAEKNRVKKATLESAVSIYDRIPDLRRRKHRFLILKYILGVAERKSDKWDMWADSDEGFDAHKVYLQDSDSLESRQHYNGLFQWYSRTITAGRDSAFDVSASASTVSSAETTKEHEERKDVNFVDVI